MNFKEYNYGDQSLFDDEVAKSHATVYSVLAYFSILWLVGLLVAPEKDYPFTKVHVNNGVVLTLIDLIIGIIALIPVVGKILFVILVLMLLVVRACGIIQAAYGKTFNIPYLDRFKFLK